jgi:hypothetical protein
MAAVDFEGVLAHFQEAMKALSKTLELRDCPSVL